VFEAYAEQAGAASGRNTVVNGCKVYVPKSSKCDWRDALMGKVYVSYKKLWKILIDRDMNKKNLRELTGISTASIAKLTKGENTNTDILVKICHVLDCNIGDIMDIYPPDKGIESQRTEPPTNLIQQAGE
jgi:DNA-binding Xre family transcriptional regulator